MRAFHAVHHRHDTTLFVVSRSTLVPEAFATLLSEASVPAKRNIPVYSRRLREAREAKGLSQKTLGIEAGIDEFVASTRVNRYEAGVHQPDYQTLTNLAEVLGLPTAYFYAEDDRLAQMIADFDAKN
jgi:DNA-binding XRE family transcriptional regulator